jgi:molecular chaperone GrpE
MSAPSAPGSDHERCERLLREERARRLEREKELLLVMVGLLDGFSRLERATEGEGANAGAKRLLDRFLLLRRRLEATLEREGVVRVESLGTPFDAGLHEVTELRNDGETPSGTVLEVIEDAYLHHGGLLRAGKVVVRE